MRQVKLSECGQIISGATPKTKIEKYWNGNINWFTPKDLSKLDGKYVSDSPQQITADGYAACSTTMLPINSLLFTSRAPIGHLAITTEEACTNQGFKSIIPNIEKVDVEFLYYALYYFKPQLQDLGTGATFKELNKTRISNFKIPLPPLPTQTRIARALDLADAQRRLLREELAAYDRLGESLFLEMFGDPVLNEKGWEKGPLNSIARVKGRVGWKGYKKTDLRKTGPLVLGATHINSNGSLDLSKPVYISREKYLESPEIMVKQGDLLIVQRGNTLGKICMVDHDIGEATINPVNLIIEPDLTLCDPQYLKHVFLFPKTNSIIWSLNNSSAQPMLTQKDLRNFVIYLPPLPLQKTFATRIQKINELKTQTETALAEADDLFNGLLQRAFSYAAADGGRGELFGEG